MVPRDGALSPFSKWPWNGMPFNLNPYFEACRIIVGLIPTVACFYLFLKESFCLFHLFVCFVLCASARARACVCVCVWWCGRDVTAVATPGGGGFMLPLPPMQCVWCVCVCGGCGCVYHSVWGLFSPWTWLHWMWIHAKMCVVELTFKLYCTVQSSFALTFSLKASKIPLIGKECNI